MIRRGRLSGIAVVLLAAACAGCASANSGSNPSVSAGTTTPISAAPSPSQRSTVPNTVSTSPTTQSPTTPRTYSFLGMTIDLPAGWQPGAVTHTDGVSFNGVVTGGSCNSSSFGSDCPGFMELYDPGYQPGHPFQYASGSQSGCPENRGLMQVFPSIQPNTTNVSVGGRAAMLTQTRVLCIDNSPSGGSTKKYTQRLWWIPSAQILVVDDGWNVSGLGGVLSSATWASESPTTPMMADFAGTWHRHTDELVINQDGFGTEVDGDGTCPNDPTSMCGFVAVLSFAPTANGLQGTYTSVLPTVNGVINLTYTLDPSEPHQHDTFVLKADPHHRLQFTQVGHLTPFDGPDRKWLCDAHTPALFNTCGA